MLLVVGHLCYSFHFARADSGERMNEHTGVQKEIEWIVGVVSESIRFIRENRRKNQTTTKITNINRKICNYKHCLYKNKGDEIAKERKIMKLKRKSAIVVCFSSLVLHRIKFTFRLAVTFTKLDCTFQIFISISESNSIYFISKFYVSFLLLLFHVYWTKEKRRTLSSPIWHNQ